MEFAKARMELSDYIRSLNDIYVKRNIYFELVICEHLSNALAEERTQEEYNRQIRESQFFYIIFGIQAGCYSLEEFEVALVQFRASGAPKNYTYFRALPEDEEIEQGIKDFMQRLNKELGHYYSTFTHLDTIKLNLLLELTRDLCSKVKLENGQALLDGQPMLSLEYIPLYSKNEAVQQMLREKQEAHFQGFRLKERHIQ